MVLWLCLLCPQYHASGALPASAGFTPAVCRFTLKQHSTSQGGRVFSSSEPLLLLGQSDSASSQQQTQHAAHKPCVNVCVGTLLMLTATASCVLLEAASHSMLEMWQVGLSPTGQEHGNVSTRSCHCSLHHACLHAPVWCAPTKQ